MLIVDILLLSAPIAVLVLAIWSNTPQGERWIESFGPRIDDEDSLF